MHQTSSDSITFSNVYSYPGNMEGVTREFYALFDEIKIFLQPYEINSCEGIGWVILELLNNAVRSPVSLAVNSGQFDVTKIDFFTDIIVHKYFKRLDACTTSVVVSVKNKGAYVENVFKSIQEIIENRFSVMECEENFMLKGSCTGNGGMGIMLSKQVVKSQIEGSFRFSWEEGFYCFTMSFTAPFVSGSI